MKVNQQLNLQQSGAVLITALIYLLVLSVVGISSMRGTAMEERMASNSWEHSRAFQAAESALLDAGQWFLFQPDLIDSSSDGSTGVWASGSAAQRVVSSTFDWSTEGVVYGDSSGNSSALFGDLYGPPRYGLEEAGYAPSTRSPAPFAKHTGVFYYSPPALR